MEADPYVEVVATRLAELFERSRSQELPEMLWTAAMAMMERSSSGTRWAWFRNEPAIELRRLRRELAEAMALARFAASLQDAHQAGELESSRPAREADAEDALARRRAQTLPAVIARRARKAARDEGRDGDPDRVAFHSDRLWRDHDGGELDAALARVAASAATRPKDATPRRNFHLATDYGDS
jgi:hypothetical protein